MVVLVVLVVGPPPSRSESSSSMLELLRVVRLGELVVDLNLGSPRLRDLGVLLGRLLQAGCSVTAGGRYSSIMGLYDSGWVQGNGLNRLYGLNLRLMEGSSGRRLVEGALVVVLLPEVSDWYLRVELELELGLLVLVAVLLSFPVGCPRGFRKSAMAAPKPTPGAKATGMELLYSVGLVVVSGAFDVSVLVLSATSWPLPEMVG